MRNEYLLAAIATLTLHGCSSELSQDDARVAFAAAAVALGQGSAAAQTSAAPRSNTGETFRAGAAGAVDYDFQCLGGGTLHFVGSVTATGDDVSGQASFDFDTDFAACKVGNITIDGDLAYTATASGTADTAKVSFAMGGSLTFSGDVDGSCDIDISYDIAATSTTAQIQYQGSVCGHDAAATLNVQG